MIQKIQGEQPFQVLATNFSISPSNEGYTLQVSADGTNYSNLFSVGAGVTRMVTGVANGSFYRLLGNNSQVAINWKTQCSDGGSGGSGSTVSVSQILSAGTEIAQITVDGVPTSLYAPEGGEGGDVYQLLPVSEFPATGDVQQGTLIVVEGNPDTAVVEWDGDSCYYSSFDLLRYSNDGDEESINQIIATFPDGSVLTIRRNPTDAYCTFKYWTSPDKIKDDEYEWEIGSEGDEERITTDDYEYVISLEEDFTLTINTKEVESDEPVSFPGETRNIYVHPIYMFDSNVETWANVLPPFSYDDNAEGGGDGLIHLETLSGVSGETNVLYECDGEIFWWNENAGYAAKWNQIPPTGATAFGAKYFGMSFAQIPEGTILFEYSRNNFVDNTRIIYEDGKIVAKYSTDNYTAVQASAATGESMMAYVPGVSSSSYRVNFKLDSHNFGFYSNSGLVKASTYWNGYIGEGHWEIVGREPYPYVPTDKVVIPNYDERGRLASEWAGSLSIGETFVNYTGASQSNRADIVYRGTGHLPSRFFAPTTVGTEGQVLTSSGNGAPVWATMIKAVQITSADYEALATKDPNTLYLIVDE